MKKIEVASSQIRQWMQQTASVLTEGEICVYNFILGKKIGKNKTVIISQNPESLQKFLTSMTFEFFGNNQLHRIHTYLLNP